MFAEGQSELGLKEGDVVWVLLDPQARWVASIEARPIVMILE